jgi:hypothetical protein
MYCVGNVPFMCIVRFSNYPLEDVLFLCTLHFSDVVWCVISLSNQLHVLLSITRSAPLPFHPNQNISIPCLTSNPKVVSLWTRNTLNLDSHLFYPCGMTQLANSVTTCLCFKWPSEANRHTCRNLVGLVRRIVTIKWRHCYFWYQYRPPYTAM